MPGSPNLGTLFSQRVVIGVGELAVSNQPQVTLSTYALGSCVGIAAYDPVTQAAGILHLMLPDSSISPEKAASKPAMFTDTGFPLFLRELAGLRGDPRRLKLFVAGGASVLQGIDPFRIGERNLQTVQDFVRRNGLAVCGSAVGGFVNRTVHLEVSSGQVTLKLPDGVEARASLG